MPRTKYREERTLVRGLHRLPGEDKTEYQVKIKRLRQHFEQFNIDIADICQWLMGLRPNRIKNGIQVNGNETDEFWKFFLSPEENIPEEKEADRMRLKAFANAVCWYEYNPKDFSLPLSDALIDSIKKISQRQKTLSTEKLLNRMQNYNPSHQTILLKAASEWVESKYQHLFDNHIEQVRNWETPKAKWETEVITQKNGQVDHNDLKPEIRDKFTNAFANLQIKDKRPRICFWRDLKEDKENCRYSSLGKRIPVVVNGKKIQQLHNEKCERFYSFYSQNSHNRVFANYFTSNAELYLSIRKQHPLFSKQDALQEFFQQEPRARSFQRFWDDYLIAMKIDEKEMLSNFNGRLPHCTIFSGKTTCNQLPHTEKCLQYKEQIKVFSPEELALEKLYREWRRDFLIKPRNPTFRYPSCRSLPTAKIFGKDYFKADFTNSSLQLRLEDMPAGEWLTFGFKPWSTKRERRKQKAYDVLPNPEAITSVHLNFIGTHARIGFRFVVSAETSQIKITQDEIDLLRSRKYSHQTQDQLFLNEVRNRILDSVTETSLRILAIDLGSSSAAGALFQGRNCIRSFPLAVQKSSLKQSSSFKLGLTPEHFDVHLKKRQSMVQKISDTRNANTLEHEGNIGILGENDLRELTLHIRRMIQDWVRLNTAKIIEAVWDKETHEKKVDLIVFESLRGFYPPGRDEYDPEKKLRLAFWSYGAIRRKVKEKAVERGMRVVTVPYYYTSRCCAVCYKFQTNESHWRDNKARHIFDCENLNCLNHLDSDENAARVIGNVFWGFQPEEAREKSYLTKKRN